MRARCQCGGLAADIAEGAEAMIVLCHCLDCQRRSGSPFGEIAYYPSESVSISGEASEYSRQTDEGNTFTSGFCPVCGSTLYVRAGKYPRITGIAVGTLTDPAFPLPARSVYEQSKHHWIEMPAGMSRHPRGSNT